MNLVRVYLAASTVSLLGLILAGALFLGALFSQRHELATAGEIALIASISGNAMLCGWRSYVLFKSGSWTTLDGRRTSREEQPTKFATWLTLHLVFAAVWSAAASFLAWTMLAPKF
jgi:hypothetical protein